MLANLLTIIINYELDKPNDSFASVWIISVSHLKLIQWTLISLQILSGLGESLNIDPAQFYNLTHKLLYDIPMVTNNKDCDAEVGKLVECLDMMIVQRRKQVSV